MSSPNKKTADLKVVLIGSSQVGKTTFVIRYMEGEFNELAEHTIGAAFLLKQHGPYNIAIWDTAGEERFSGLSAFYCRDAGAAIMAFDLTSKDSFEKLRDRFLSLLPPDNCLKIVIGTKLDLIDETGSTREVTAKEARTFAEAINDNYTKVKNDSQVPYFETSSKTGEGVDQVFEYIFKVCLSPLGEQYRLTKRDTVKLHSKEQSNTAPSAKKSCCKSQ